MVGLLPSDIPKHVGDGQQSESHVSRPKHDPLPNNYSHSEIVTYDAKGNPRGNKLGRLARKEFQQILSQSGVVVLKPTV